MHDAQNAVKTVLNTYFRPIPVLLRNGRLWAWHPCHDGLGPDTNRTHWPLENRSAWSMVPPPEGGMEAVTTEAKPICPHCGTARPYRWGRENGNQRYRCRSCKKTFRPSTATPLAGLQAVDRLSDYADATIDGLGVRRTADRCGVSPATIQRWRHRLTPDDLRRALPCPGAIVSFFGGLGLLDLGFEKSRFDIMLVNERHPPFAEAYRFARGGLGIAPPRHGIVNDCIGSFLAARRDRLAEVMTEARRECGIVGFIGGPPCPDFSVGGRNLGEVGEHGKLSQTYVDLICEMRPDFLVFENVAGLVRTAKHGEFFDRIRRQLSDAGYATCDRILNAIDFGVPQDRQRVFLIGFQHDRFGNADDMAAGFDWYAHADHRGADDAPWPGSAPFLEGGGRVWPRSVPRRFRVLSVDFWFQRNAVQSHPNGADCFKPRGGHQRMQRIDEGDTSRKSFKRLHRFRFSPTAAYGNNEIHLHPWLSRRLTVAEVAAIQSLPSGFVLPPDMTLTDKFRGLGNGVPYLLALGLARTLADCLLANRPSSHRDYAGMAVLS